MNMKGAITRLGLLVFFVSSIDVSVSLNLKRLDRRVRRLEDQVQQDSSEFRDNFDIVFDKLNESVALNSKTTTCALDKKAVFRMCPSLQEDIGQELNRIKKGFAKEKDHIRQSVELFEREVCNTRKEFTAVLSTIGDTVQEHCNKPNAIAQVIENKLNAMQFRILEKLDSLTNQNQQHRQKLHAIMSHLNIYQSAGSMYTFNKDKLSWDQAKLKCQNSGGYLAVVDNEEEGVYLTDLAKRYLSDDSGGVWLGGSDLEVEGVWRWVNTERLLSSGYTNWLDRQPSNYGGNEHCLHMWSDHGLMWNDARCASIMKYICEFNEDA